MDVAPRKHLLLDYGQVISLPQPAGDLERLAALAGLPMPELAERYWVWREPYDRGGSARAYWSAVLGTSPDGAAAATAGRTRRGRVDASRPRRTEISRGSPYERASVFRCFPTPRPNWPRRCPGTKCSHRFEHLLFSSELRLTKPDSRIYAAAIAQLELEPADIVFVDDRPEERPRSGRIGLGGDPVRGAPGHRDDLGRARSGV